MRQAIVRPLNSMLPDFKALHSTRHYLVTLSQFERIVGSSANKALPDSSAIRRRARVVRKCRAPGRPREAAKLRRSYSVLSAITFSISPASLLK
jgi:hypothetical protein